MLTVGRFVILLVIFGAIAHVLLGGGLSLFSDYYRIWRISTSRQEIILVRDVNTNDDRPVHRSSSSSYKSSNATTSFENRTATRSNEQSSSDHTVDDRSSDVSLKDSAFRLIAPSTKNRGQNKSNTENQGSEFTQLLSNGTLQELSPSARTRMMPQNGTVEMCPETPPNLVGPIKVWFDEPSYEELQQLYPYLEHGGHGKPKDCIAQHKVAIVVPYRDRDAHLRILLHNLHSLLTKQQLDYAIFIVEQYENETFNRAKLMNVGFAEAMKLYNWDCFIFHDVDLLPEDDRNIYSCPKQPRHMSVAIDKFQYKLPYGSIFGGISAMKTEQFVKINGFSNDYWGWGGEDDDLSTRVNYAGYQIMRYPSEIARYKMIKHSAEKKNPLNKCRYDLMAQTKKRQQTDGLTSLNYECYDLKLLPLFTHIKVKLLEEESKERLRKEGFKKC